MTRFRALSKSFQFPNHHKSAKRVSFTGEKRVILKKIQWDAEGNGYLTSRWIEVSEQKKKSDKSRKLELLSSFRDGPRI